MEYNSVISDNEPYVWSICKCKVKVSGFCEVEMAKLPFRQMAEAKIGSFDDERKRTAVHRISSRGTGKAPSCRFHYSSLEELEVQRRRADVTCRRARACHQ